MRVALGVSYRGQSYHGWQSQADGRGVQDALEKGLAQFADRPIRTICAGRTDSGVHGLNQVVHFDTEVIREASSWVRGSNRYLPPDIAIQWCRFPGDAFHARFGARSRRYTFLLLESVVRPAVESGACGWVFRPLDGDAMGAAAAVLIGEHDFSSFRSSECQADSPVKTLRSITISRRGASNSYWRFDFDASAYLHHMIRNLMGCMIAVGNGSRPVGWMAEVLAARDRKVAAPTFPPDGLYFVGPTYDAGHDIPTHTAAMDWLP
jgi:tRNA pseudouridine38-40 synthase